VVKSAQPLVGVGLGGIQPVNLNYQHPEVGSDPEVGTRPAAKPLNQGVGPPAPRVENIVEVIVCIFPI
jgi:hypothetical protein